MKNKNLFISNFKFNPINNKNDGLTIKEFYNISLKNGYIKSAIALQNSLYELFDKETAEQIENNNQEVLNTAKQIIPYEFFDELTNKYVLNLYSLNSEEKLYKLNNNTNIFELKYTFSNHPNLINSDNELYFFSDNECVFISENSTLEILTLNEINSFTKDANSLYFTLKKSPQNLYITELIKLKEISNNVEQYSCFSINADEGEIYKIINIKEKIFVFTKYSIFKFDEDDNKLIKQNSLETEVYKNTIQVIDDMVLFYSSSGLIAFDGNDTSVLIDDYLQIDKNAKSLIFNQNLYIFSSNRKDFLFKYNLNDDYFSPIKLNDIENFYLMKTRSNYNICISKVENNIYKNITLFNEEFNQMQMVEFNTTTFGSCNQKIIRNIYLKLNGTIKIKIESDLSSIELTITNSQVIKNISLQGTYFKFTILGSSNFSLENLMINYDEIGD